MRPKFSEPLVKGKIMPGDRRYLSIDRYRGKILDVFSSQSWQCVSALLLQDFIPFSFIFHRVCFYSSAWDITEELNVTLLAHSGQ